MKKIHNPIMRLALLDAVLRAQKIGVYSPWRLIRRIRKAFGWK